MTEDSFISLQKLNYFLKDFTRNKFFFKNSYLIMAMNVVLLKTLC